MEIDIETWIKQIFISLLSSVSVVALISSATKKWVSSKIETSVELKFQKNIEIFKNELTEKTEILKHDLTNQALKEQTAFRSKIEIYPVLLKKIKTINISILDAHQKDSTGLIPEWSSYSKDIVLDLLIAHAKELLEIKDFFIPNKTANEIEEKLIKIKLLNKNLSELNEPIDKDKHFHILKELWSQEEKLNLCIQKYLKNLYYQCMLKNISDTKNYYTLNSLFMSDEVYKKTENIIKTQEETKKYIFEQSSKINSLLSRQKITENQRDKEIMNLCFNDLPLKIKEIKNDIKLLENIIKKELSIKEQN